VTNQEQKDEDLEVEVLTPEERLENLAQQIAVDLAVQDSAKS